MILKELYLIMKKYTVIQGEKVYQQKKFMPYVVMNTTLVYAN